MDISLIKEVNTIYSKSTNVIVCMEEISELIEQLAMKKIDKSHIAEEVCDVLICLKRIQFLLKIRHLNYGYIRFDRDNSIITLSNMQKCLSKYYRNTHYNNTFIDTLGRTKMTLDSIIRYYKIKDEVNDWIDKKEKRTRNRIDSKNFK